MGDYGAGGGTNAEAASFSPASRSKGQMDFASGPPSSSSGLLPRISEIGGKSMARSSPEGGRFDSWDDSALLSDNFLKGLGENDRPAFSNFNSQENQVHFCQNKIMLLKVVPSALADVLWSDDGVTFCFDNMLYGFSIYLDSFCGKLNQVL